MKRFIARRVLHIVAICAVLIGFALLAGINMFGGPIASSRVLTAITLSLWGAVALGYAVRVVRSLAKRDVSRTKDPLASAGETVQDIYLGRVTHPAPPRDPDEYSAYASAPPWLEKDESTSDTP